MLEIEDDTINISSINWLGDILLAESIEYKNQSFQENSIFNKMLLGMKISKRIHGLKTIIFSMIKRLK